jgi:hypothetical protein
MEILLKQFICSRLTNEEKYKTELMQLALQINVGGFLCTVSVGPCDE